MDHRIARDSGILESMNISPAEQMTLLAVMTSPEIIAKYYVNIDKKRSCFLKTTIRGTTCSGKADETTCGNTIRNYSYW